MMGLGARIAIAEPIVGRVWSGDQPAARAVVLLDSEGAAQPSTARLDEVWLSFVPRVQVVAPGSTLVLTNADDESHTVHAWSGGATLWNRGTVRGEGPQRVTLTGPGVIDITCDIHDSMHAFIVVSASAHSAVADLDGRFSLGELAPGRYHVRVWRPDANDDATPGHEPGRDAGFLDVSSNLPNTALDLRLPPAPPRVTHEALALGPAHEHTPSEPPAWMRWLASVHPWPPDGPWAWVLAGLAVAGGILLAIANLRFATRRGWSRLSAVLIGCALAFVSGTLIIVGLHVAVAAALGFGVFIGTAIFGAGSGEEERATK